MSLSWTIAGYRTGRASRKAPASWHRVFPLAGLFTLSLILASLLVPSTLAQERDSDPDAPEPLPRELAAWLDEVQFLITNEEREFFLSLKEDFRRFAFIDTFWAVRDPNTDTPYNEFKRRWDRRRDEAQSRFGGFEDDRSRALLLHGPPGRFQPRDGRVPRSATTPARSLSSGSTAAASELGSGSLSFSSVASGPATSPTGSGTRRSASIRRHAASCRPRWPASCAPARAWESPAPEWPRS